MSVYYSFFIIKYTRRYIYSRKRENGLFMNKREIGNVTANCTYIKYTAVNIYKIGDHPKVCCVILLDKAKIEQSALES